MLVGVSVASVDAPPPEEAEDVFVPAQQALLVARRAPVLAPVLGGLEAAYAVGSGRAERAVGGGVEAGAVEVALGAP